MKNLLISGNTLQEWNLNDILKNDMTREQQLEKMDLEDWDNTIGKYCDGSTYYEIEQLNRYNDKRLK